MDDKQIDKELFFAFVHGRRIASHSGETAGMSALTDPTWDTLNEIAEGKATLLIEPEVMLTNVPADRNEFFRQYVTRSQTKLKEHDREIAKRIINEMSD